MMYLLLKLPQCCIERIVRKPLLSKIRKKH